MSRASVPRIPSSPSIRSNSRSTYSSSPSAVKEPKNSGLSDPRGAPGPPRAAPPVACQHRRRRRRRPRGSAALGDAPPPLACPMVMVKMTKVAPIRMEAFLVRHLALASGAQRCTATGQHGVHRMPAVLGGRDAARAGRHRPLNRPPPSPGRGSLQLPTRPHRLPSLRAISWQSCAQSTRDK